MTAESEGPTEPTEFAGRRVVFVGRLGSMSRREAHRLVRQAGGTAVDRADDTVDLIVIGADELPIADDTLLDDTIRDATAEGRIEVISETQFWQRLGVVESDRHVRRLYTPAMLAHLLGVSVAVIRRWHRRGLIVPVREIHRLPYFDFQEVATARRLAELLAAGATPQAIERKLEQLTRLVPDVERPLAQLSVIVEGRQLLLRQGEGLIEPGGQMRLDFSAAEQSEPDAAAETPPASSVISMDQVLSKEQSVWSLEEMESQAAILEDTGRFTEAIEMYRAALVAGGPSAEICFRLAELLYLTGDISAARERYSMAVELDEDYVEARANLGCVLAETGDFELALAAFQGALQTHPEYPDVHYHMARTLDRVGREADAEPYWAEFLRLAPDSPWADEAHQRLGWEEPEREDNEETAAEDRGATPP